MLIVLIGPKGSGKSHIGRLLEASLGVYFFHVEIVWISYFKECEASQSEPTTAGGIQRVHPELEAALNAHRHVCVETTGASPDILSHLLSFRSRVPTLLVRINAPIQVCLERIHARDCTNQIATDQATIERAFQLSSELELPHDIVLENGDLSNEQILGHFHRFLREPR